MTNTNQQQLDFDMPPVTGEQLRDIGIQQAVEHADKVHSKWSDQAFNFLVKYIQANSQFMVEDVRIASAGLVPEPPSLRAWGGIIVRAAKANLIKRIGFKNVCNSKAHCTPASLWQKLI